MLEIITTYITYLGYLTIIAGIIGLLMLIGIYFIKFAVDIANITCSGCNRTQTDILHDVCRNSYKLLEDNLKTCRADILKLQVQDEKKTKSRGKRA